MHVGLPGDDQDGDAGFWKVDQAARQHLFEMLHLWFDVSIEPAGSFHALYADCWFYTGPAAN